MLFPYILYVKVINKEVKLNGAPFVAPKARSSGCLEVPCFVETLAKGVLAKRPLWGRP
jgi:hypothetical protein